MISSNLPGKIEMSLEMVTLVVKGLLCKIKDDQLTERQGNIHNYVFRCALRPYIMKCNVLIPENEVLLSTYLWGPLA